MPIDIEKLLKFPIPSARQELTPNLIALYALSVGLGVDPLDPWQLRFADPLQGPEVIPSMVLIMAHPGFWMADPASGIDPAAILHAGQGFEILGPLPGAGIVESQSAVTEVIDKGPGKAALIEVRTELCDGAGRVFARLDRSVFIRGGGGFGGNSAARTATPQNLDRAPDRVVDLPTMPNQALLYRLNGDLNPLHSDPALAARQGFARPILHGLCTMGVVTHALLRGLAMDDTAALRGLRLRFTSPVYPGETIRTEMWSEGRFRARVVERDALVVDQGEARVVAAPHKGEIADVGH